MVGLKVLLYERMGLGVGYGDAAKELGSLLVTNTSNSISRMYSVSIATPTRIDQSTILFSLIYIGSKIIVVGAMKAS
jgi:hypothetical protein